MRIVVINDFSSPNGGASSIAIACAEGLVRAGEQVVFMAGDSGVWRGDQRVAFISLGAIALSPNNPAAGFLAGLYNHSAEKMLSAWVAENDDEQTVYHIHCWSKIWSPSIFKALRKVAYRVVVHAHDYFPVCPNGAFIHYKNNTGCDLEPGSLGCALSNCDQRSYAHKLWRFARSKILDLWADFSVTGSKIVILHESMRAFFVRAGVAEDAIVLIENPCVPYLSEPVFAEQNAKFVFVGRLVPEKGVEDFLLAGRAHSLPMRVVGGGSELIRLQEKFPEADFVGWQNRAAIGAFVRDARVVVAPSRMRETFGLVAAEALGSGIPVVVADTSPLAADIMRDGAGYAVSAGNVLALGETLKRLSEDNQDVRRMSRQAVACASRLALTPEVWISILTDLYVEICSGEKHA